MRHNYKPFNRVIVGLISIFIAQSVFAQSLYEMPQAIESRMASGENPAGEKGKGGQANGGRKGAATVSVKAGESRILGNETGGQRASRRFFRNRAGTKGRFWICIFLRPGRQKFQLYDTDAV